jgi:hypothetical protein
MTVHLVFAFFTNPYIRGKTDARPQGEADRNGAKKLREQ